MKTILLSGYSFIAATRTLDCSATSGFDIRNLIAVLNVTRNAIIYAPGVSGLGYSNLVGGNVLTLSYDTTGQNNADALTVYYDAGIGRQADAKSLSVALSTEDAALLTALLTATA